MMRRVRGVTGLAVLLALAVGLPWALAATIGNPLHQWSSIRSGDMSDRDVIAVMAAVAYLAWASFAVALLVESAASLASGVTRRPRRVIRLPLLGPQQDLARTLIAAVLLLAPAVLSVAGPATSVFASTAPAAPSAGTCLAPPHQPPPASMTPAVRAGTPGRPTAAPGHGDPRHGDPAVTGRYVIPSQGGMRSYWALAEHYLGDGQRWPEIWHLNQGHRQSDGSVLDSPNLLRRGWTVTVPPAAAGSPADRDGGTAAGRVEHAVTVHEGDTLSGLAQDAGVPDWTTVWPVNADRAEPGGQQLSDPNLIKPGWTVLMPGPASATPPDPTVPTRTSPRQPPAPATPPPPAPRSGPDQAPPSTPPHSTPDAQPTTSAHPAGEAPAQAPAQPTVAGRLGHSASPGDSAVVTVAQWAASLSGGAGVLAGGLLLALRRYRRRQFRHRGSGRAIAGPAPRHAPLERVLVTDGAAGVRDVDFIDRALRGLSLSVAAARGRLPCVRAVRLTAQHLDLVLAAATDQQPPAPWVAVTPTSWAIEKTAPLPEIDGYDDLPAAPYPTLVSVGYTAAGEEWLVDLEHAASLSLTGDAERCLDLARFVVAELAHNTWSDQLTVTLAGFGDDGLVELNPARLIAAPDIAAAAAAAAHDVRAIREIAADQHVDVLQGRLRGVTSDSWMPQLLFLAPAWAEDPGDEAAVRELLSDLAERPHTAPVAVVMLANPPQASSVAAGLHLDVDERGVLRIPSLDVTATAQQLPADQAGELAQYLAAVRDSSADVPMPPAAGEDDEDETFTDRAGAILPEHTLPRPETPAPPAVRDAIASAASPTATPAAEPPAAASSLLPKPTDTYVASTAATAADVQALAPLVKPEVSAALLGKYPHLDEDLAAWNDPDSDRAKLRLLGDVGLTAFGTFPDSNDALVLEAIAYLALHRRGVTGDQIAAELWPHSNYIIKDSNPRNTLYVARSWLGRNPLTGQRYLPHARSRGLPSGAAAYRVSGLLVDWDLFTGLRTRAEAREAHGQDGLTDLVAALDLVRGKPLSKRRVKGWGWLVNDDVSADEAVMGAAILDVAQLVVTRALDDGDLPLARRVAELTVNLGCGADQPLLNLAAVCEAQGRTAELAATVRRIVTHHGKVVEEDIPSDTYDVLLRRGWVGLTQAG